MFGIGQPAAANHANALRKIDQGTAAHKKEKVPAEMHNAAKRVDSFFGRSISKTPQASNHNQVRSRQDAITWGKAGFFSGTVLNNSRTMKDFVVCAGCGEQARLQSGDTPDRPPASTRHTTICNRQKLVQSAASEISSLLPAGNTDPGLTPQGLQPAHSQSYPQRGGGRPY